MNVYGQLQKAQLENLTSDPTPASEGLVYYNTSSDTFRIYSNGAWATVPIGTIAASLVVVTPAGTIAATDGQAALVELDGDIQAHISDASAAHAASAVAFTPAGNTASATVQLAIEELQSELDSYSSAAVTAHIADTVDAHDASAISFSAVGTIAATDVQTAIAEVATDAITALAAHTGDTTDAHIAGAIGFSAVGTIAATDVQAAIAEVATDADSALTAHTGDATDAHAASAITNTPSGNLAASTVQAALDELQTDVDTRATSTALTDHINDTSAAHAASAVAFTPTGNTASATVQLAIEEIQTEVDTLVAAGGVTSVAAIDSGTPHANGAQVTGGTIIMQSATATLPGLVNNTTQTFAGVKTFNGNIGVGGAGTSTAGVSSLGTKTNSGATYSGLYTAAVRSETSASSASNFYGVTAEPSVAAASTQDMTGASALTGIIAAPFITAAQTGTLTNTSGMRMTFIHGGSGTVTNYRGIEISNPTGAGTVTNSAGIAIAAITKGTNTTSLLVGTTTVPTGTFSLYNASTTLSHFTGPLAFQRADVASAASITQVPSTTSTVNLTGSTATTIHGIATGKNGQIITIHNVTNQIMTLKSNSGTAASGDRIVTQTGADLVTGTAGSVSLQFNTNSGFWHVTATQGVITSVGEGGTNIASYASGDILYASSATALAKLAKGSDGQVLKLASGLPSWGFSATTSKTTTYTATSSDDFIAVSGSGGGWTLTLPAAASNTGKVFTIKRTDNTPANAVTIDGNASETIDGATTRALYTLNESVVIVSDGTNWQVTDHKAATEGVSYSPAIGTGAGAAVTGSAYWHRVGDRILIRGRYTAGTVAASLISIALPTGVTVDTTKIYVSSTTAQNGVQCGMIYGAGGSNVIPIVLAAGTSTSLAYAGNLISTATMLTPSNGNASSSTGVVYDFNFDFAVTGWW